MRLPRPDKSELAMTEEVMGLPRRFTPRNDGKGVGMTYKKYEITTLSSKARNDRGIVSAFAGMTEGILK